MSDYENIIVEKKDQVDWVTLNRPESLNAITTPMVTELRNYFGNLMENDSTRIVVLRGAGKGFCAGLDIKASQARTYEQPFSGGMGFQGYLAEVYIRMRRCPQPIISLVHGPACGGGFSFVLASDIRIAGESSKMNAAYIRIGLSACDMGSSYFLPRLVGTSVASSLCSPDGSLMPSERFQQTWYPRLFQTKDLEKAAETYIDEMLATSPMGLRLTKEGLNMAIDAAGLEAAMALENRNQLMCSKTEDAKEGMRAFIEKRSPQYTNK